MKQNFSFKKKRKKQFFNLCEIKANFQEISKLFLIDEIQKVENMKWNLIIILVHIKVKQPKWK